MRILFLNQYYWPDGAATAQMLSDLCEDLARQGHEVHVLCSRGAYDDGTTRRASAKFEVHNGVQIHRIGASGLGKKRLITQAIDFATFHLFTGLRALWMSRRCDIVVTLTTPPLIGLYGLLGQWIWRTRHVCWVMDLHPDAEFEIGMFHRDRPIPRLLNWLNGLILRRADCNVVLGRCMAARLRHKGVPDERIEHISVWGHDLSAIPQREENPLRRELGLTDRFIVMYSGNAGVMHSFDEICQAALALRADDRFVFLFIGGGRRLREVLDFKQKHSLENIRHMGYLPREQLSDSLTLADVHLISLRENVAGVAVPCKLYGIMAAGRPAIFIGPPHGETALAIAESDSGTVIPNAQPQALVDTLRRLADDPAERQRLGDNARAAFTTRHNLAEGARQWTKVLEAVGGGQ